jgi:hypothetical protein
MVLVQIFIGPVQRPPPNAKASGCLSHSKVRVQDDPIDAIVTTLQKIGVKIAQLVGHDSERNRNCMSSATLHKGLPRRGHFFAAQSAKKRSYFPAQKSELHFLIEPSIIPGPAIRFRIGGLMNYVGGCCAIQGRIVGVILELGAV